ncbi:ATP-dependent endonuclease [Pseudomonas sp. VI4.1]|uniref:ATP-dependent nuclease n=1 Tax=Pseudomonas sp. VI4.1 TaxID=1941346 RepID=UPI0009C576FC|nr:AAA family ATPase [Pseudomonas sp. VI4.1]OPK11431.1 hypothetical protein BZ163_04295 [Pseudomonas sp. VI4.1]
MKLNKFITKDGEEIKLEKFTLLVGPNNVGKSQTLKDIHKKLILGHSAITTLISTVETDKPSIFEDFYKDLDIRPDPININHHIIDGITSSFDQDSTLRIVINHSRTEYEQSDDLDFTYLGFSKFRVFYMDSESRLKIATKTSNYIPAESAPKNLVQALYGSTGEFDEKLRNAFQETFGMDIKLDYSSGLELRLAISDKFETTPEDPRYAYPIMKKYPSIEHQGDGFRSFAAIILSLLLSRDKVVLLDEPEAFLHPEQARRLGKWISDHARDFPCQIIVATHNANFLSGILSGNQPADIYRLNRSSNTTKFNRITSDATQSLSKSPILSSQRVLEGIFSKGVVVCESDTDRIIYNAVAIHELKNQEILFIHAHNKQTIKDVVKLLKDASIPTAAVIDIDILNSESDLANAILAFNSSFDKTSILKLRSEISSYIESSSEAEILEKLREKISEFLDQLNEKEHSLSGAKGALNRIYSDSTKWSKLKKDGLDALDLPFRTQAEYIIKECKKIGLFIVPVGELEGWIKLGVRKNRWVLPALEKIHNGECPNNLIEFVRSLTNSIYDTDDKK